MNFYRPEAIAVINKYASEGVPFLLISNFEGDVFKVMPLENIDNESIKFWINGKCNFEASKPTKKAVKLSKFPITFEQYKLAFEYVKAKIIRGDSFLTNLTCETPIELNISLLDVFEQSNAKYKLWIKDEFVCFSPEIFVRIDKEGKISSFPMKGTIDSALPDAEKLILGDKKEFYEHTTIVDLIRNDLSKIAEKVWVEKFRYIDKIKTHSGQELLQVSSQVSGLLSDNWKGKLGDILLETLPAGSISGAPKEKTLEIIAQAEEFTYSTKFEKLCYNRGFYTGILGVFDGETFDSGVMIRFIENTKNGLVFKSGGGITSNSVAEKEYDEMIQKIYVPII